MTPRLGNSTQHVLRELPYWRLAGAYFFYFAYLGAFAPYFSLYLSAHGITAVGIGVIYKFEKIKRAKRAAIAANPDRTLLDFGIGENDDMAAPIVRQALKTSRF